MRRQRGFTLMEMLITVAIVAILVLVAIPVFSSALDSSRAATCASNCRSMKGLLTTAAMTQGTEELSEIFVQQEAMRTCPSGGTVSYSVDGSGTITVSCSIHTPGGGSFEDEGTITNVLQTMATVLAEVEAETDKKFYSIDSGASRYSGTGAFFGVTDTIVARLEEMGLDLPSMGAVSWRYETSGKFFYWTPVDIQTGALDKGDQVPVIRYNANSGNFSVWYSTVNTTSSGGYTFYVLNLRHQNDESYTPSTSTTADGNQTYAGALGHLLDAMETSENADVLCSAVPEELQDTFAP